MSWAFISKWFWLMPIKTFNLMATAVLSWPQLCIALLGVILSLDVVYYYAPYSCRMISGFQQCVKTKHPGSIMGQFNSSGMQPSLHDSLGFAPLAREVTTDWRPKLHFMASSWCWIHHCHPDKYQNLPPAISNCLTSKPACCEGWSTPA